MSAYLFIERKRKKAENIDFVSVVRTAINGSKTDVEKSMSRWARDAEIPLIFED